MRESPTKILAQSANPAVDTDISVTIGATNDGRVYHIKALYLPTTIDTGVTGIAFQITDASDVVIWSGHSLTDLAIGTESFQAHRVVSGFTDGDGSEIIVLPDKMIVPGGYKVKTLSDTVANVDHGVLTIFGSVFKAL